MQESALPLPQSTCPAGSSSLATTQLEHRDWQSESGQRQRIGWLEAAWPFASLNLPGPYLPLDTDSLSRGAAAAGPRVCKASSPKQVQVQVYWQVDSNRFEFRRAITNIELEVRKKLRF